MLYKEVFFNPKGDRLPTKMNLRRAQRVNFGRNHPLFKNPSRFNHFEKLPDEVILQIFASLPKNNLINVSKVCRRFNRLADDVTLWAEVGVDLTGLGLHPSCLEKVILHQIPHVILREAGIPSYLPAAIDDPGFEWRIRFLDLKNARVLQKTLTSLFGKCKNLIHLTATDVGDDALLALSANTNLKYLSLSFSPKMRGTGLEVLLKCSRRLKQFVINCTNLTPLTLDIICRSVPSSLREVTILGYRGPPIKKSHVHQLVARCPKLINIKLSHRVYIFTQMQFRVERVMELEFLTHFDEDDVCYMSFTPIRNRT